MTSKSSLDKRHVSGEGFDRLLDHGVPVVLPVPGEPAAFLFIDPHGSEMGIRFALTVEVDAPDTRLRNVLARVALRDGRHYLEVVVTAPELFHDAYPILCSMADRVQLGGLSPAAALRATLDKMASLLHAPEPISREREIGLFGELLMLGGLIDGLGVAAALDAWRGSEAEEHDFALPEFDVEVKTTTNEARVHWIESLTQLVPKVNRPLWLLSHQLTTSGTDGLSLPELIDGVRGILDSGAFLDRFEEALTRSGWREEYRARPLARWVRRSTSTVYRVSGTFPRLTPEDLRKGGLVIDRVSDVRYRVHLDGLDAARDSPEIIHTAGAFEGWK